MQTSTCAFSSVKMDKLTREERFKKYSVFICKTYGILLGLIFFTLVLGICFNQLPNKNPDLIPHASWCHHSSLFIHQQHTLENITFVPKKKKTTTPLPWYTHVPVTTTTTTTTTTEVIPLSHEYVDDETDAIQTTDQSLIDEDTNSSSTAKTTLPVTTQESSTLDESILTSTSSTITTTTTLPVESTSLPQTTENVPTVRKPKKKRPEAKLTYIPSMSVGLHTAMALLCFIWPILPLLLHINSRNINEAKLESIIAHILGQTTNFGVAEIFRTQIAYPEDLFLEKCNVSPEDCLFMSQEKVSLPLYLPPVSATALATVDNSKPYRSFCKGQYYKITNTTEVYDDGKIIYNSLHHFPDPVCFLLGASIVCFLTNMCQWRIINPKTKSMRDTTVTIRSILAISDIAIMATSIFYLYQLYITYDLLQLVGIFVGVLLQLMINRTISYRSKKRSSNQTKKTTGVEEGNVEQDLFLNQEPQEQEAPIEMKKNPIVKK